MHIVTLFGTVFLIFSLSTSVSNALPAQTEKDVADYISVTESDDDKVQKATFPSKEELLPTDLELPTKPTVLRDPMESPDLFEGDLKIPQDLIDKYYGNESNKTATQKTPNRSRRAARRDRGSLWRNGVVYYAFDGNVNLATQNTIRMAMNMWAGDTCLQFRQRSNQNDYIRFTANDGDERCFSSYVGRDGGRQRIQLGPRCRTVGVVLHEIGHAVGLWHEHTRPDRNRYIRIVEDNIDADYDHNFNIRNSYEVDYQGSSYDYGSVMHYRQNAFSHNGRSTIEITNNAEYESQGRPTLGQQVRLSARDASQIRRLYNCPGSGVPGILKVYIKYARDLPDTDPPLNDPDPYARVTAVDDSRRRSTKHTNYRQGTENPDWYQWLDFGGRRSWQYFEVSVWDSDSGLTGADDRMTDTQAFSVSSGYHSNIKHCRNQGCSAYMYFDYNLILDGNECRYNPCQNGGTCIDRISSYTCSCRRGYGGTRCQYRRGRLRIYARYGRNLPDEDPWLNDSDPYFQAIAYRRTGDSVRRNTGHDQGDQSPEWYQWLDFGVSEWYRFDVQIWDADLNNDDALSRRVSYYPSPGCHNNIRICGSGGCGGYVYFNYCFDV